MTKDISLLIFDWEGTLMGSSRELFPGVKEMLLQLKEKYLLAVATNRYRRSLDKLIAQFQLENIFNTTRCADESGAKPNPQMLLDILEELNVFVEQAVMIGDSESDMAMAKKIGMPRIAVGSSSYVNELIRYEPIACVSIVTEITTLV